MMKYNKKQLIVGLLFVALASRMYAADNNALIEQAREFARQLQMHCNQTGSDLVHRLIQRVEHLMPLQGQHLEQAARITSLEEKIAQAHQQREAVLRLLGGVPSLAVMPTVSSAPAALEESSSSSSSQSTLIDDVSDAVFSLPLEDDVLSVSSTYSVNRMKELMQERKWRDALDMGKAIMQDTAQNSIDTAQALCMIGDIYYNGSNAVRRNNSKAMDYFERALAMSELPSTNRAQVLAHIGDMYCDDEDGAQDLSQALQKFREALAIENGLSSSTKELVEGRIAEINEYLQAQQDVQLLQSTSRPAHEASSFVEASVFAEATADTTADTMADRLSLSSSSSQVRPVIRIGRELLDRVEHVRFNQAMDCYNAKNFSDAFNQFLAIAEDETELPVLRAKSYAALGALARISGQANIEVYKTALAFFNNAQALCDGSDEALMNNIDKNIDELIVLVQTINELPPLATVENAHELQDDQGEQQVRTVLNKRSEPIGARQKPVVKRRTFASRNEAGTNFCVVCQHQYSCKGTFTRHMKQNPTHLENQLLPPPSALRSIKSPNDSGAETEEESL